LENKAGFFQPGVESPAAIPAQRPTDQEDGLNVEYAGDQAILVQLPETRLQEQLDLALGNFSFSLEDKRYEDVAEQACLGSSMAPELGSPVQEVTQRGEDELQSQPHAPYAIYIRHPSATPEAYTLVVDREELQAHLSLACATPTEDNEVEW
jgi:hypothetical protein